MQCDKCRWEDAEPGDNPPWDYFLCPECYGTRKMAGFGPELEEWYDKLCSHCSTEQNRCRTCADCL